MTAPESPTPPARSEHRSHGGRSRRRSKRRRRGTPLLGRRYQWWQIAAAIGVTVVAVGMTMVLAGGF